MCSVREAKRLFSRVATDSFRRDALEKITRGVAHRIPLLRKEVSLVGFPAPFQGS
jgi:hypothetical protein